MKISEYCDGSGAKEVKRDSKEVHRSMRGIVYSVTLTAAKQQLQKIVVNYAYMGIPVIRYGDKKSSIQFENGDIWYATHATDNARGRKWNIAYIDADISRDVIQSIIMPAGTLPFTAVHWFNINEENYVNTIGIG